MHKFNKDTQPKIYENIYQLPSKKIISIIFASAVALLMLASPLAHAASKYQAQINNLKQENASTNSEKADLQMAAGDLAGKIASLQAEISTLEGQIQENQAKDQKLQDDIAAAEIELAAQKHTLGINIKQMYVDDQMTTIEMVASSKNMGDYLDKETYRTSVQNQISDTMAKINALKKQLDDQRAEVQRLLADQQTMQSNLSAQKAEQDRLLSLNQQQQDQLNAEMAANNSKIAELKRLQALENARYNVGTATRGGTGSYPWANVPFPNELPDPWGMYKRQCVSYTAWKVANTGRHMPYWGGHGNAKQWDDNARADGIPVDYNPQVGDVAISNSGTYGHAMYVEAVHGDGTITVSQYNAGWDGDYSVARRAVTGLSFIHF
jgi:surface antigen